MKHTIINAVLFQCVWFAAILQGALLALPFLIVMAIHAFKFERTEHSLLIVAVVCIGIGVDSLFYSFGYFSDVENAAGQLSPSIGVMPLWLASIWCGFALTLGSSMSWFKKKPVIFVMMAGIAAPLSYTAGDRLGALSLDAFAVYLIAVFWIALASAIVWGQVISESYVESKLKRADS